MSAFRLATITVMFFFLLFVAAGGAKSADLRGLATVHDGDTLKIARQSVRLNGIDAPELKQTCQWLSGVEWPCGVVATEALRGYIDNHRLTCKIKTKDRYGRAVGECLVRGKRESVNAWMVRAGWAVAYREYSKAFISQETAAREAKRGIWQGTFVLPKDYRKAMKAKGKTKP